MTALPGLSLPELLPLGMPGPLPVPPPPTGPMPFQQLLVQATDRQGQGAREIAPRPGKAADQRRPEPASDRGEWRELRINRESPANDPQRPRPIAEPAASSRSDVPRDPQAPVQATKEPAQEASGTRQDALTENAITGTADASVAPDAESVPESGFADGDDVSLAMELLATPLTGQPLSESPVAPPPVPTLEQLFPEYFSGAETQGSLPVADTPSEPSAAGMLPPAVQLVLTALPQEGSGTATSQVISPRERRYGFGLGKPFAGHAAVNRRHIDRFQRPVPLPENVVVAIPQSRTGLPTPAAAISVASDFPELNVGRMQQQADSVAGTVLRPGGVAPTVSEQSAVTEPEIPTFGQPVAYRPLATHLKAATPGFEAPIPVEAETPVAQPANLTAPVPGAQFSAPGLSAQVIAPPQPVQGPMAAGPLAPDVAAATLQQAPAAGAVTRSAEADAPVPLREVASRLTAQLTKDNLPEGTTRLRVTLRPPDLGTITIELTRKGDQLQTRIVTRTSEAHLLFERLLPELRQQLTERGFQVREFDLAQQQSQYHDGDRSGGQQWARPQQGWEKPPLAPHLLEVPEQEGTDLELQDLLPGILQGLNLTV
ncbi:MAG: hypothetical protein GEEBNDBF_01676 [bacterium]|nr:hypothetical protein [bacterium]